MVRTIDAAARRRLLAEAVWRIVEREGLAAASVRTVAAESGLSTGSVRHFFGTQRELIAFAMSELVDTVTERIARSTAVADPQARALAMLSELVPLDGTTRTEALVWLQFVNQARFDSALGDLARPSFEGIRRTCVHVVELLRDAGALPADVDVDVLSATLNAVVDGLTLELLFAEHLLTPDDARTLLRNFLRGAGRTAAQP